ncbi:E3 ubiquitin-protein ligase RNF8-A [Habropoda laboriosa]|uniref:E3 ubiquitin-protein ligase CHFR n=1 Tax=Habropoda laboriosa TaxID=597456 RepID=A0A0L7RGW4_9HYME|nr:E3 ubiquitin-protein ligase RNF8-A [Habropoda laboriosa]
MEGSKAEKRLTPDDSYEKPVEPILVRVNKRGCHLHDIHIDKNEFKIGRATDNDEILLDPMISRRHCMLRWEGQEEWTIKDLSSSATFVNDVPLTSGMSQNLRDGDVIQFSILEEFKYVFTLVPKDEYKIKKPKIEEQVLDNVLIEQRTFAENEECQKRVLKDKLQIKQKEQDNLIQQLEQLVKEESASKEDTENLKKQITVLKSTIEDGYVQVQHLQNIYSDPLEKLENEHVEFEKKWNDEKQKLQEALNVTKQEKEMLEIKMREQMEKWKSVMENRVKEEKNIQAQLLNEKTVLEEKLKETEKALKEQEAKVGTIHNNGADPTDIHIIDTIDLTVATQLSADTEGKESVLNKVNDIMDEQLTCSICSELFVKATTLNCTHTFCQYCIKSWSKKRKECPVCRARVSAMNRSLVLDNFIESMLENLPTRFTDRRKETIKERQGKYKNK